MRRTGNLPTRQYVLYVRGDIWTVHSAVDAKVRNVAATSCHLMPRPWLLGLKGRLNLCSLTAVGIGDKMLHLHYTPPICTQHAA